MHSAPYVLEMISELACSHTYTGGGDRDTPGPSNIGLLGVDWGVDDEAGRYRIARILLGQNWVNNRRSLTLILSKGHDFATRSHKCPHNSPIST